MILLFALAATALAPEINSPPPPFFTAQERWRCAFKWEDAAEWVAIYFGIYRSHVRDDFGADYAVAQNDDAAAVFVFSDIGNTDVTGKTRKWTGVSMIDKKTGEFKRTNLDFNLPPQEAVGRCSRY